MIRDSVEKYIRNTKNAFQANDLDSAVKYWKKIHEELDADDCHAEFFEAMSQFSNDEVFTITEYSKKMLGYY
ncbi:MAG: hypothetical protein K2L07_04820 [Lachnospiraceae bacterium]|nr:hypothetical protein [Lachnospiraceae bacterium]